MNFTGTGADDVDNHLPVTYLWNFDGGAANSAAEDPGDVAFNAIADTIYNVMFIVTDSIIGESAPATVQVEVIDIPTLSQWGLIFLTMLMLSGGILSLRRSGEIIGEA